jgi:hypothetical protein
MIPINLKIIGFVICKGKLIKFRTKHLKIQVLTTARYQEIKSFSRVFCLGLYSNVTLGFVTHALQDPPLKVHKHEIILNFFLT